MQSQLAAALLGHNTNATSAASNLDDDENFREDEPEDTEEFDEMLLGAGILKPGAGAMTIEYLGQKFVGDLLEDGKIRSQETDVVFASPSAWAIACKRFINPDKKSGCGWASVKYKGKKLDAYKNVWYKKKKEDEKIELEKENANLEQLLQKQQQQLQQSAAAVAAAASTATNEIAMFQRFVVKHNTIANRTITHDGNTMIECVPFASLGKIPPFLISLHTNAVLLMDFHCHLTKSEVSGYLAGHWDVNSHNLVITHAFPCRNTKADRANASAVEQEISNTIDREKLTLVGWYHSHPFAAAAPTLRDVDAQLDYQIKMRGTHDNSYTPCIGVIISPYNPESVSLESGIVAYWVVPPPETKPNEYGRPMLMSYSVVQDVALSPHVKDEIAKCVTYYKKEADFVDFSDKFAGHAPYIDKLKTSLMSKFPRDETETAVWRFIRETLEVEAEEKEEAVLSIPKPGQQLLSPAINSNLILPTDISSLLFSSGRFPSPTSLLGLPDPMAHSTLAANNMFLSTNLFKMQELLKPFSSSSSSSAYKQKAESSTKTSKSSVPLKIPNEQKVPKTTTSTSSDFSIDFMHGKTKEATSSEYLKGIGKAAGKTDFFMSSLVAGKGADPEEAERPAKVSKLDYAMDFGYQAAGTGEVGVVESEPDAPLNLTGD
ncbi:MPN domain-containing protein CG4751 isoform X2 [Cylas formicarius]|uniref:MPN domain-containing protein CG4751 isoform X2 n=1 Tax=Cylas formicarius TaxID=197179 RepID=UPI002958577E|nr:MPN domain-containing protein CG4751 isoform X2 [Cylas formicarius]